MESFLAENSGILNIDDMEVTQVDVEIPIKNGRGNDRNGRLDMLIQYNSGAVALVELKHQTLITDPATDKNSVVFGSWPIIWTGFLPLQQNNS